MAILRELSAAREALTDTPSAVLNHLLVAWREVKAPAIADVIDLASKLCRRLIAETMCKALDLTFVSVS